MKIKIAVIAALLLCGVIACDTQKSSNPTTKDDKQLEYLKSTVGTESKPPLQEQEESRYAQPEIKADSEVKDGLIEEGKFNTEDYDNIVENNFLASVQNPLSTFSIDVDEAAYSNVRRYLQNGSVPPPGAVRIEEMINYFDYVYPKQGGKIPFTVNTETGGCLWNTRHRLVYIGLQSREIPVENFTS